MVAGSSLLTHCVSQVGLQTAAVLLCQPPKCWNYRLPHLTVLRQDLNKFPRLGWNLGSSCSFTLPFLMFFLSLQAIRPVIQGGVSLCFPCYTFWLYHHAWFLPSLDSSPEKQSSHPFLQIRMQLRG